MKWITTLNKNDDVLPLNAGRGFLKAQGFNIHYFLCIYNLWQSNECA